jgi:hypothetical protein
MRRVTTILALALCLLGCGSGPHGEPVALAITSLPVDEGNCYTIGRTYAVVADPNYGTAYMGDPDGNVTHPLYWPAGYTGWRVGSSEVEVRDLAGKVVAVTGRRYQIYMGHTPQGEEPPGLVTSSFCIKEQ